MIGPLQGGLEAHLLLEEVGPLRDLEVDRRPAVLGPDLARPGEDLARHQEHGEVVDDVAERQRPGEQVVLVGAVGVALAVAVVLVDEHALRLGHDGAGGGDRPGHDHLARLVVARRLQRVHALRRGVLGVGVVDVEAGAVGEHHVDQPGLQLGWERALVAEAAGVAARRLLVDRPLDAGPPATVGVDHRARGEHRVEVGLVADRDAVLGLGAQHPGRRRRLGHRYCPGATASIALPSPWPAINRT